MGLVLAEFAFRQSNSRVVKCLVTVLEVVLLSAGLSPTLVLAKKTVLLLPHYCGPALTAFWTSLALGLGCLFSSPLAVWFVINVITVLLIAASSWPSAFFHCRANADHGRAEPPRELITSPPSEKLMTSISNTGPAAAPCDDHCYDSRVQQECSVKDVLEIDTAASHLVHPSPQDLPEPFTMDGAPPTPPLHLIRGKQVFTGNEGNGTTSGLADEDEETMEATWKAITGGGKQEAQKKHLKKCETWDVPPFTQTAAVLDDLLPPSPQWKELRKAETFNSRRGGLIRRDPSVSVDEFNNQVEAFIKKFNDDLRLQRQESSRRRDVIKY